MIGLIFIIIQLFLHLFTVEHIHLETISAPN